MTKTVSQKTKSKPLSEQVRKAMKKYFATLGDAAPANIYEMVMTEVEPELLKAVIKEVDHSNTKKQIADKFEARLRSAFKEIDKKKRSTAIAEIEAQCKEMFADDETVTENQAMAQLKSLEKDIVRTAILKEKKIQIEKSEAEKFYKVHETKPFYNDLCYSMLFPLNSNGYYLPLKFKSNRKWHLDFAHILRVEL